MAEWQSTMHNYNMRVTNIGNGVGVGGAWFLQGCVTVINDLDLDELTGGLGEDWFFRRTIGDVITDVAIGEVVDLL